MEISMEYQHGYDNQEAALNFVAMATNSKNPVLADDGTVYQSKLENGKLAITDLDGYIFHWEITKLGETHWSVSPIPHE